MGVKPAFALLLLGHVLGDFYFQTDKLAKDKKENGVAQLLHSAIYTACVAATLFIGTEYRVGTLYAILWAGGSHWLIDFAKINGWFKQKPFVTDQLIHVACLYLAWYLWVSAVPVKSFVGYIPALPFYSAVDVLLGLLIILRPAGFLIASGDIWDFGKNEDAPIETQKGAGRMTGYLERTIVFLLLLCNQYGAFTFVLAAKSVLRFSEINASDDIPKKRALVEYYLIGTLLSMTSVFATAMLLGFIA